MGQRKSTTNVQQENDKTLLYIIGNILKSSLNWLDVNEDVNNKSVENKLFPLHTCQERIFVVLLPTTNYEKFCGKNTFLQILQAGLVNKWVVHNIDFYYIKTLPSNPSLSELSKLFHPFPNTCNLSSF